MSNTTPNLGLFKYDPNTDGNQTFDLVQAINTPYDKIDAALPINAMSRQAIINGNFDIWQRGTSWTNPAHGAFLADRFFIFVGGTLNNITISKQALTPGDIPNSYNFLRVSPDGAWPSPGVGDFYTIRQKVEHGTRYLCGMGKKITISFWARSTIPGKKLAVNIKQDYGTGGTPSATEELTGNVFTLSSAWTKYAVTFTTNTLVGKTFGSNNDDNLTVLFWYMWGTSFLSRFNGTAAETFGGAGTIDIAQVQLCAGDVALPFQPRSFAEELQLCQRYYERWDNALDGERINFLAIADSTTNFRAVMNFRVKKRKTPTMLQGGLFRLFPGGAGTTITFLETSQNQTIINASTTGATLNQATCLQNADSGGWIAADAEI